MTHQICFMLVVFISFLLFLLVCFEGNKYGTWKKEQSCKISLCPPKTDIQSKSDVPDTCWEKRLLQIKKKGNRFRQKEPPENNTHLAPVKVQLGRGLDGKRLSFCSWNSEKHSSNSMRSFKAKVVWERRPTLAHMLIRTLTGGSLRRAWAWLICLVYMMCWTLNLRVCALNIPLEANSFLRDLIRVCCSKE